MASRGERVGAEKEDAHKQQVFHRELLNHGVLKPASKGYISLIHSDADVAETLLTWVE